MNECRQKFKSMEFSFTCFCTPVHVHGVKELAAVPLFHPEDKTIMEKEKRKKNHNTKD